MIDQVVLVAAIAALPSLVGALGTLHNRRQLKQVKHEVTTANGGTSLADLMTKMEQASRTPIDKVDWIVYVGDHPTRVTIRPIDRE